MSRRIFCKVLLVIVAVFSLLVASGVLSAQGRSEDGLQRAIAAQESHSDELMAKPGVVGTAVGLNANGRHIVMVLLEKPGIGGIPNELDRIPVQAVVTGKFVARLNPEDRWPRPVPIGVSTGHPDITAGTIGCRVTDGTNVYALSNNHVYADENQASIGDAVIQPGTYDGGASPADDIGTLADFEPIKFGWGRNTIDAAIAEIITDNVDGVPTPRVGNATPPDGYGTPKSTTLPASVGMQVKKYGRTTDLTSGQVDAVNANVWVGYATGTARFMKQIIITPGDFSAGGDSGSLIVTNYPDDPVNDKRPVGLLFAGSSTHTVANPIDLVLTRFGVTVDSSEGPVDNPPTVAITNPSNGDTVSGSINLTADASDDNGVTQVEFFVDGSSIGVDTTAPYEVSSWDSASVADGLHTIKAVATDTISQTASDSVSVTVDNEPSAGVTVTGISPNTVQPGNTVDVTITGSGFASGADVTFENGSGPAPTASNIVVVDGSTITARITAKSGGPPRNRVWDVRVTNPDGSSGVGSGIFTVTPQAH